MIKKKIGNQIVTLYKVDIKDIAAYSTEDCLFAQDKKDIDRKEDHSLDNMLLFV